MKRACVFVTGIDSMLDMHRLAWERADCAAIIIASHLPAACERMSHVEMGVRRGRYLPSLSSDPWILCY